MPTCVAMNPSQRKLMTEMKKVVPDKVVFRMDSCCSKGDPECTRDSSASLPFPVGVCTAAAI